MTDEYEDDIAEKSEPDDILEKAKEKFLLAQDMEKDNREDALADIKFGLLGEQWDAKDVEERKRAGRPTLTINKFPAHIRQVVNDARQNKPAIRFRPEDDNADPETAEILNGLMRNIETSSSADIAYDSAIMQAVSGGFGYLRVNIDFANDDSFDKDIKIERVYNQFSVYGDPHSTSADGSDWNCCFVTERLPLAEFKEKYPEADPANWELDSQDEQDYDWINEDGVWIAEYWKREEVPKTICLLSDGDVVDESVYEENIDMYSALGIQKTESRVTKSHKVTQYIITSKEILETNEWAGRWIPVIPVYGEEVIVENKRVLKSLIRDSKDSQRIFNYWRTTSTELVALAPKTPFIGEEGAFDADLDKWETANTKNHAYLQHTRGTPPPQRQPFAGVPAGIVQEALNAADDIKATMGMFGASIGEEDNAISGRAIMARQRESDTGTFHFIDNLSRSLRHIGRIVIDLVPHVYQPGRIIRVVGEDGKETKNVKVGQQGQEPIDMTNVYDLTTGKYDVIVEVGPGYTTKRQEAATQMIEFSRVVPEAAGRIGDLIAKNLDWPGADEIAERLNPGVDPQVQQMQQMLQQMQQQMQQLQMDKTLEAKKIEIDAYKAETERLKAMQPAMVDPNQVQALVMQTLQQVLQTPDITPGQVAQPQQPQISQQPQEMMQ